MERSARQGTARTGRDVRAYLEQELSRLETDDPFAALEVSYEADDAAIRAAFLAATKRLHPNRFARQERDVVRMANEVYLRVKDAYHAIQDPTRRRRQLDRLGKRSSPRRVAAGTADPTGRTPARPPGRKRVTTPVAGVQTVRRIRPRPRPRRAATSPEELQQQALASKQAVDDEYNRGKRVLLEDHDAEAAVALFRRLAAEHSSDRRFRVWMHLALAHQHHGNGDLARAREEYRRSLELDPEFEPAKHGLAELPGESNGKKGLFSKLFRR